MSDPARILHVSPFHPELVGDAAARAAHALFRGMRAAGLDAGFLAACQPATDPGLFKPGAVITGFDGRPDEYLFLADSLEQAWYRNLNLRALTCFADFLREMRPQVVHFHHFGPLGLDLLLVARRTLPAARLVLTLHDFLGMCRAEGRMLRPHDGTLCDRASPVRCHQCFRAVSPEMFLLREDWVKHAFSAIDAFVAPTDFLRRRFAEWGLPAAKLHVLDQAQDAGAEPAPCAAPARRAPHDRFGFFGDPVDSSGLGVLLDAAEMLEASGTTRITLDIGAVRLDAATGELRSRLDALRSAAPAFRHVRLRLPGAVAAAGVAARLARVDWVVAPSLWWDPAAPDVSLARAFGKPPIGSGIGGIAERVRHEQDGLLFEAGDAAGLAELLHRCATEEGLHARLAAQAPCAARIDRVVAAHRDLYGIAGAGAAGG